MKMSQLLAPTLREDPQEAEVASHRLMLRAGLIRRSAAGMYTFLPLGFRVLQKVIAIIREEMDRQGAQELLLPIVQPAELWLESGRWHEYGEEMFRLKDRHGRAFCLGPTHEEIITALVRSEVNSYRQLPLLLYQIQNKYRDEIRPRFGVMRGREFIMKDLYSFDRDEAGLDESYAKMFEAYTRTFRRCGLTVRAVEADPGAIGGSSTHEFMVLADSGEAEVVFCTRCDYAANVEKAECPPPDNAGSGEATAASSAESGEPTPVATPGVRTIEELTRFLGVDASRLLKTMVYLADGKGVAVVVRGDHQVNEIKLKRLLQADQLVAATPEAIEQLTGAPVGFVGPVNLQGVEVVADWAATTVVDGVCGANRPDTHLTGVTYGRDWHAHRVADVRVARAGDPCPRCRAEMITRRGIEVGQLFKLGTKYSAAMGATFLDADGKAKPIIMGCYGIGVSRTVAAIIEQHHDENGIRWPVSVAPYQVIIVPVKYEDPQQARVADELYASLQEAGVEVVLDERSERAGVKFKDADLIGFPLRITVGPKALEEGCAEFRWRDTGQAVMVPLDQVVPKVLEGIQERLAALQG